MTASFAPRDIEELIKLQDASFTTQVTLWLGFNILTVGDVYTTNLASFMKDGLKS